MNGLKTLAALAAVAAALAATDAYAADAPRYDFLDLSRSSVNEPYQSFFSTDLTYDLSGSYAFAGDWVGAASYSHEQTDFVNGSAGGVTGNSYETGVGYRFALTDSLDVVPRLSYSHSNIDVANPGFSYSFSASGYHAGVLLRAMVTDKLELDASLDHTRPVTSNIYVGYGTLFQFTPSTPVTSANQESIAALYDVTPSIALGLGVSNITSSVFAGSHNTHYWSAEFRYYFN
jgi:hypothetical protein